MQQSIHSKWAILIAFIFLVGCGVGQGLVVPASNLATQAKVADIRLQSGEVAKAILSVPLDDQDLALVSAAFGDYSASRATLEGLTDDLTGVINGVTTIQAEHARLQEAYFMLRAVVRANWNKYSPVHQARLQLWTEQATQLEIAYQSFVKAIREEFANNSQRAAQMEMLKLAMQLAVLVV